MADPDQTASEEAVWSGYSLFSSPKPLAHVELLWSLDIRHRPLSTIASKDIS